MSLINSSVAADDHSAGRRYQCKQQPSRRIHFPTTGRSASPPQAARHAPQSPKISVSEGERFLFPTDEDEEGPAGIVEVPTSASAQPWGTSLPLKHHAWHERDASLSDWTCSYSARTQQTEPLYLKTANQP